MTDIALLHRELRVLRDRVNLLENPCRPIRPTKKPRRSYAAAIPEIAELAKVSSLTYRVPVAAIFGRNRQAVVVEARQWVMFEARALGMSLSVIGHALDRDHSTVLHGIRCEELRRAAA